MTGQTGKAGCSRMASMTWSSGTTGVRSFRTIMGRPESGTAGPHGARTSWTIGLGTSGVCSSMNIGLGPTGVSSFRTIGLGTTGVNYSRTTGLGTTGVRSSRTIMGRPESGTAGPHGARTSRTIGLGTSGVGSSMNIGLGPTGVSSFRTIGLGTTGVNYSRTTGLGTTGVGSSRIIGLGPTGVSSSRTVGLGTTGVRSSKTIRLRTTGVGTSGFRYSRTIDLGPPDLGSVESGTPGPSDLGPPELGPPVPLDLGLTESVPLGPSDLDPLEPGTPGPSDLGPPDLEPLEPGCGTDWDGIRCWHTANSGQLINVSCSEVFQHISNTQGFIYRNCTARGWSDPYPPYDEACVFEDDSESGTVTTYLSTLKQLYTAGYATSLISLITAVTIFTCFRKFHCTRNYIHINLFVSFILRASAVFIKDTVLFSDETQDHCLMSTIACKTAVAFFQFCILSNYFWLLVEGMYLQTLLALTFVSQRKYFWWYILIGWGWYILKNGFQKGCV
ncbi:unnamed protein product [Leuciscus chuanchicus]